MMTHPRASFIATLARTRVHPTSRSTALEASARASRAYAASTSRGDYDVAYDDRRREYGNGDDDYEYVSSVENAAVKRLAKLCKNRKFRDDERAVVLASSTLMRECFGTGAPGSTKTRARVLFLSDTASVPPGVDAARVLRAPERVMKKCAGVANADGLDVVGEFELPHVLTRGEFEKKYASKATVRVLALEGVQDPGNLGTLARTAVAFGWDALALLPGTCDAFNDKAMRAARGATFRIDLVAFDSFDALKKSAKTLGMDMYAAEPDASQDVNPERAQSTPRACLVLGTEGRGLSDEALGGCQPVAVPMAGDMESLNVGIAGGVLMYLMRSTTR
jgi:RNA methyltransferase, TrmH family